MPRVIGIDPGTISIDLCGLDDGRVFVDTSLPTSDALADPSHLVTLLEGERPLDMIAGPSGYGLPLTASRDLTDDDLRLAHLSAAGEGGGIGGLSALLRALARADLPVVLTPGVIHLASVPEYRKANRVDMGTADKVCATALAVHEQAARRGCRPHDTNFILLELGGAFTAAVAVEGGAIVDGAGGTSGALGLRAAGALDGEVAYLAGTVGKGLLFQGGAATIAGIPGADVETIAAGATPGARLAREAYLESAVKTVASLTVSASATEVILSGRAAHVPVIADELTRRLASVVTASVHRLRGFASTAKQAAQGAALIADGLAGGRSAALVDALGIRGAAGTVLDHLYVIDRAAARARLGLAR